MIPVDYATVWAGKPAGTYFVYPHNVVIGGEVTVHPVALIDQFADATAGLAEWGPPDYVVVVSNGRGYRIDDAGTPTGEPFRVCSIHVQDADERVAVIVTPDGVTVGACTGLIPEAIERLYR
jgi:hypothetical protein